MDMSVETFQAQTASLAGLASILGGFAFATFATLVTSSDTRRRVVVAALMFAFASGLFLFLLLCFTLLSNLAPDLTDTTKMAVFRLAANLTWLEFLGVFLLLASIGITGWLRSRTMGLITTGMAVATALATMVAIVLIMMTAYP